MALIALTEILYKNNLYLPGDELPADTPAGLIGAWIDCRTAEYMEEPAEEPSAAPKAKAVTAPAGQTGIAYPSAGPDQDIVGRVPDGRLRGAVKEPSKRPGRKSPK